MLFPHTPRTREWVPRLAARLDTGLVMDCTMLAVEGKELVATKPVYGGGVWGEFVIRGAPRMATIRPAVFERRAGGSGGRNWYAWMHRPRPGPRDLPRPGGGCRERAQTQGR